MTPFDLAAVRLFLAAVARVREPSGGKARGVPPLEGRRSPEERDVGVIVRDISPMCSDEAADAIRTYGWAEWVDRREAEWLAALAREGGLPLVHEWLLRLPCARMRLWAPPGHSQALRLAWPDGRECTIRRSRTGEVTAERDGMPVGIVDYIMYPAEEPDVAPQPDRDAIVPVRDYQDVVITEAEADPVSEPPPPPERKPRKPRKKSRPTTPKS